jgi:hypothetical protein
LSTIDEADLNTVVTLLKAANFGVLSNNGVNALLGRRFKFEEPSWRAARNTFHADVMEGFLSQSLTSATNADLSTAVNLTDPVSKG